MRIIPVIMFLFICSIGLSAQQISVNEEPGISALMNKYLSTNKVEDMVKAWRIQIITTSDRREMQSAKAKFERFYPQINLDWNHVPPYYKVKVGAWRDKISCDAFLSTLIDDFPLSIPVVENISKSELLK